MDPDEVLELLRAAVLKFIELDEPDAQDPAACAAAEVVDHFNNLDGWLSKGGFLPTAWWRSA